jgi:hypothetical protein
MKDENGERMKIYKEIAIFLILHPSSFILPKIAMDIFIQQVSQ